MGKELYNMKDSIDNLFNKNLLNHQKNLSGMANKYCFIGGFLGVGFYILMKLTGIMSDFKWSDILYFCIPVLFNTTLMGLSFMILRRKEDRIYVNVYKYIIVLVACINYFAISMFVPYRDAWVTIILIYFVSAYYLDFKVALFGIVLSSGIGLFTLYFNTSVETLSTALPHLLTRIQVISFGSIAAFISTVLGRNLLYNSCQNEYNVNETLENIQAVNSEVKRTAVLLGTTSEHITELSSIQYTGAETTASNVSNILDETVNTVKQVNECIELMKTLAKDTTHMKLQASDAINNSNQLKQTAVKGTNSIEDAVSKITGIKDSAIKTYDSAKEMDERTKKIKDIVNDIQNIAEETNLLSLNASIEAARAGIYGAGFAVVAEEIRKLSEQSQNSLRNVNNVIANMNQHDNTVTDLVEKVDEGVTVILKLNEYYQNIINDIDSTIQSLGTINKLADDQEKNVSVVNRYINRLNDMANNVSENIQETSAATQQTFSSCEELLVSAKRLDTMAKELNNLICE
jgi:methyl-accepting chemotaxis protein